MILREEQEEEERSEPSPGALRDRVPGSSGGGRGSALADSSHHLKPGNSGPHRVLLVKTLSEDVKQNSQHQQHRAGKEDGAAVEDGSFH